MRKLVFVSVSMLAAATSRALCPLPDSGFCPTERPDTCVVGIAGTFGEEFEIQNIEHVAGQNPEQILEGETVTLTWSYDAHLPGGVPDADERGIVCFEDRVVTLLVKVTEEGRLSGAAGDIDEKSAADAFAANDCAEAFTPFELDLSKCDDTPTCSTSSPTTLASLLIVLALIRRKNTRN